MGTLIGSVAFCLTVTFVTQCQSHVPAGSSTYSSPYHVTVEKTTNESITVKWSSTGALQYKLIWSDTSSDPAKEGYTIYTTFTIRKLLSGNLYFIFVKGCDEERICSPSAASVSAVTEPNRPQNLRLAVDRANSLTASWTSDAVLDTIHTVTVTLTANGSEVDRRETQWTTYVRNNLDANTSYTVWVFSSLKDYPNTKGDKEKALVLTYPAAPHVILLDIEKAYLILEFYEPPAKYYEATYFDIYEKKCTDKVHIVHNMNDTLPFLCDSECDAPPRKVLYTTSLFTRVSFHAEPCGNYSATVYKMNSAGCSNGYTSYTSKLPSPFYSPVVSVGNPTSTTVQLFSDSYFKRCNYVGFHCSYNTEYCLCERFSQCLGTGNSFPGFPKTLYTIDGLQPWTGYTFVVSQLGKMSYRHVRTRQAEPAKPHNVTYDAHNGNLTWDLDCRITNGIIQYFVVNFSCHEQDRPFVISEEEQLNVTEQFLEIQFKPFRTCTVKVAGYTIGLGDVAEEIFDTSEHAPGKVTVKIGSRNYTSILLLWDEPEERNGLIISYTIQWKDSSSEERSEVLSEDNLSYSINSLTPATDYTITVFATNKVGKGEKETFIVSTWTGLASPVTDLSVKVDKADALKLDVSWKKNETTGPTEYLVCVSEKDDVDECRFHETVSAHESDEYETSFRVTNAFWDHAVHIMTIVEKWDGLTTTATSENRIVKTGKTPPGVVADLKALMQYGTDCRMVSVHWTALLPKEYNGMFKNYTVVAWVEDRHDSPFVTISVEDPKVTTATIMLDGGRDYTIEIFATNDAFTGQSRAIEFETLACAPIVDDSEDDLVQKTKMPVVDEQRTFAIAYDDVLFRNDSFGKVELRGFIIRDVTENFQPAHKSRISRSEFEEKHRNKWIDYFGDDTQGYRIDLTDNRISKQSINEASGLHEYLLGDHGKCDGYCNGYLKPSRNYKIQLFSCTSGGCLITGDSLVNIYTALVGAKPVATGPDVALITLGTFVGILLIAVIAVIILVLRLTKLQGTKLAATERTAIQEDNVPDDHTYDYIVDQFGTIRTVQKGTLEVVEINLKEMDGTSQQGRSIEGRDDTQHSCQGAQDYYNVASNGMKKTSEIGPYESLKSIQIGTYLKDPNCTQGQEMKEENCAQVKKMEEQDIKNEDSKSGDDSTYTSLDNDKRNITM